MGEISRIEVGLDEGCEARARTRALNWFCCLKRRLLCLWFQYTCVYFVVVKGETGKRREEKDREEDEREKWGEGRR